MKENIRKLEKSITQLEKLVEEKLNMRSDNQTLIEQLKGENIFLKKEYDHLKQTSQEVINELNNSIQVIDEYFKKENANS